MYPIFIGKAEAKRTRPNLKNRSRFSEPHGLTRVRTDPCFFHIERLLKLKKPQNRKVHGFSGRTVRSGPDFKTMLILVELTTALRVRSGIPAIKVDCVGF